MGNSAVSPLKICVVAQDYPSPAKPDALAFIHARNLIYKSLGHSVSVLSFAGKEQYEQDGVSVLPESEFSKEKIGAFDLFVFHAPNLRNHLRFILKNRAAIKAKVLIGHGHEFINAAKQSGGVFPFQSTLKARLKHLVQSVYDVIKLRVWVRYFKSQKGRGLAVVFVSDWLRKNVEACLNLDLSSYAKVSVINNPIHPAFQDNTYDPASPKVADFVTVRSFDRPKYAVDVVLEIARRNPQWSFHIYGTGELFNHNPPPPNLTVIKKKFRQQDMPALFNQYRAGLLPTRWDSQGVLMCEMACLGMPTVVSELEICRLMVGEFENVSYIENENPTLTQIPTVTLKNTTLKRKFSAPETVQKELELFAQVVGLAGNATNKSSASVTAIFPGATLNL